MRPKGGGTSSNSFRWREPAMDPELDVRFKAVGGKGGLSTNRPYRHQCPRALLFRLCWCCRRGGMTSGVRFEQRGRERLGPNGLSSGLWVRRGRPRGFAATHPRPSPVPRRALLFTPLCARTTPPCIHLSIRVCRQFTSRCVDVSVLSTRARVIPSLGSRAPLDSRVSPFSLFSVRFSH